MEEKKMCPLYKTALLMNMGKQVVDRDDLKRYTECDGRHCGWWARESCGVKNILALLSRVKAKNSQEDTQPNVPIPVGPITPSINKD